MNTGFRPCLTCVLPQLKLRWLLLVMITLTGFAGVELWVGRVSHSLTLRADSAHMLTDGLAMAIALVAAWVAQRSRSTSRREHPAELLAALINGLALLAMAGWIGREAWAHWQGQTGDILSMPMLITALLGLLINGLNLRWCHGNLRQDLNLRGVILHIFADLLGSVGAIVAAIAVTFLQWTWADTVIGTGVAGIIGISALPLLWQSWRQLTTPAVLVAASPDALQNLGWLEVGHTDWSRLITK